MLVVRHQQHGEHEALVHGVIQTACAGLLRRPRLEFVLHVRAREDRRGQADEGGEHQQVDIEGIDVESPARRRRGAVIQNIEMASHTEAGSQGQRAARY